MIRWLARGEIWMILIGLLALWRVGEASRAPDPPAGEDQEVRVQRVLRDPRTAQPVAVLADPEGQRAMPIWIGEAEAAALEAALRGVAHRRPLTHDLLAAVLEKLEARIVRVRITELREDIFYAVIHLQTRGGPMEMDARPSDAMVLAVRARCPISVQRSLFLSRSTPLESGSLQALGLEVQELTEDLRVALGHRGGGVLVTHVAEGGAAGRAGLRRADVIVAVGDTAVDSVEDLERALEEGRGRGAVAIVRRGQRLELTFP